MKSKWIEIPLGEYAKITMGQSPKSEYYNENKEGTPFLQGNKTFGTIYPTFEKYTTKITKLAKKNEILFSVRAPVGEINIAPEQLCIGRGLAALSSSNNLFLYYLLKYNQNRYEGFSSGTVFSSINKNTLNKILVNIPDLETQKKITSVLWSLDSKIELNNQMIDTLEEIASTLFKRWFVDFEFPDENGNPYKSSGGKMIDSELGEIPEGWKATTIDNLYKIKYGKELPINELKNNGYPVQGANGKIIGYTDRFIYKEEVALVTCRGNGSGDVFRSIKKGFVTNNLLVFQPKYRADVNYTRFLLANGNTYNYRTGSAQPQITIKNISRMKVINPFEKIRENYEKVIKPIMNHQILLQESNNRLEKLKDSILPKLMSGEIEV